MDARAETDSTPTKNRTTAERTSDRELVIRRTINGPARIVFEAWTRPELFPQWWIPKSFGMTVVSCEMDVRVGGGYRLVLRQGDSEPMAFFGKYLEVKPNSRLAWTNEESEGGSVTTLTLEEKDGKTLLVMHDLYPSKEAFDAATGEKDGMSETFDQLDEFLASLDAS